ncbi:MAG: flavin-dependent oxidoreductase [Rhodospirillaceae bacterium]|nr:flavin-dependent oxidoreductase [Rhodospirillaceae bacterium]
MTVLIAGGGIAGLSMALTCHQIGAPFKVFESIEEIKQLGVGINLQPVAVRELIDLGLEPDLGKIGVRTRDYGMYTKAGLEIWTEPRGTWAGNKWPQYSVHRGMLHMKLYEQLVERAGPDCVETGWAAAGFENTGDGAVLHLTDRAGETRSETGAVVLGADGIHSAIRAQMAPDEGPPVWGGFVLWRGTTRAKPFLSGASMVMVGHGTQRFVSYPISETDPETGEALINWIASIRFHENDPWNKEDWNRIADIDDFLPRFIDWKYDWLDVPETVLANEQVYEYPMVDRDPLERWTFDCVSLIGDAAHAAYPVGSNGAGQAIVGARKLGAAFVEHGLTNKALRVYEDAWRPLTTGVINAHRSDSGPDGILDEIEERCGGVFDRIEDVISRQELRDFAENYKKLAGTSIDDLNALPQTIAPGATVQALAARASSVPGPENLPADDPPH